MFIKILKSISSYVYHCSLSLFIAAFKVLQACLDKVKGILDPPLFLPLFPFNSFKPEN